MSTHESNANNKKFLFIRQSIKSSSIIQRKKRRKNLIFHIIQMFWSTIILPTINIMNQFKVLKLLMILRTKHKIPSRNISNVLEILFSSNWLQYLTKIWSPVKGEGERLTKCHAVYNFDGSAEQKGFEVKRRGELRLKKNHPIIR